MKAILVSIVMMLILLYSGCSEDSILGPDQNGDTSSPFWTVATTRNPLYAVHGTSENDLYMIG
jgi:hypothetical protein